MKLVILSFLMVWVGSDVQAGFEADRASFCANPSKHVCSLFPPAANRKAKLEREAEGQKVSIRVLDSMKASAETDRLRVLFAMAAARKNTEFDEDGATEMIPVLESYLRELRSHSGITAKDESKLVEKWKESQRKAIQGSGLSAEEKKLFLANLEATEVLLFEGFFSFWDRTIPDWRKKPDAAAQLFLHFIRNCGPDGMKLSGRWDRLEDKSGSRPIIKKRYVLACPGFFSFEKEPTSDPQSWGRFAIWHELGHANNLFDVPTSHAKFAECVFKQYDGKEGVAWHSRKDNLRDKVFYATVNEMAADVWAAETLAQDIVDRKKNGTEEALSEIVTMLKRFCTNLPAHESYPSDAVRIDTVGKNPSLQKALVCPEDKTPSCVF